MEGRRPTHEQIKAGLDRAAHLQQMHRDTQSLVLGKDVVRKADSAQSGGKKTTSIGRSRS